MRRSGMVGYVGAGVDHTYDIAGARVDVRSAGLFLAMLFLVARHVVLTCVVCVRGKRKFESNTRFVYRGGATDLGLSGMCSESVCSYFQMYFT